MTKQTKNTENNIVQNTQRHYARGDFKQARKLAVQALTTDALSQKEKDLIIRIQKATGIDPVATAIFTFTGLLLVFFIIRYIL